MTDKLFTTAYAGHGDTTDENIKAVLDQLLPDALGLVFIPNLPKRVPAGQPAQSGLRKTIAWLVGEVGQSGTIPVDDLIESLLLRRGETGDEIVLVMVYDPENEDDQALALAAHEQGIRVVDLCQAGDDIVFDEPGEDEPPFDVDEKPLPEDVPADEPASTTVTDSPAGPLGALQSHIEEHQTRASQAVPAPGGITVNFSVTLDPMSVAQIADAIVAAMGRQATAQVEQAVRAGTELPDSEPPARAHPGTAAAGPAKDAKDGKPYYYNKEKDSYRRARGIATKGEEKVFLTEEEVERLRKDGMLS